jgi:hypothetical protein
LIIKYCSSRAFLFGPCAGRKGAFSFNDRCESQIIRQDLASSDLKNAATSASNIASGFYDGGKLAVRDGIYNWNTAQLIAAANTEEKKGNSSFELFSGNGASFACGQTMRQPLIKEQDITQ